VAVPKTRIGVLQCLQTFATAKLAAWTNAKGAVATALGKEATINADTSNSQKTMTALKDQLKANVLACKATKLQAFYDALGKARTDRVTNLEAIVKAETAEAASVKRCEKAWYHPRGDITKAPLKCAATDCCGAAKGKVGGAGAVLTVELCQPKATESWTYVKPRDPMSTKAHTDASRKESTVFVFRCIEGAQMFAASATLLLSAWMLA